MTADQLKKEAEGQLCDAWEALRYVAGLIDDHAELALLSSADRFELQRSIDLVHVTARRLGFQFTPPGEAAR